MDSYESIQKRSKEWSKKLAGKTLVRKAVVQAETFPGLAENEISELDLPESHRIFPPNTMGTMDFRPERLNVTCEEEKDGKLVIKTAYFG